MLFREWSEADFPKQYHQVRLILTFSVDIENNDLCLHNEHMKIIWTKSVGTLHIPTKIVSSCFGNERSDFPETKAVCRFREIHCVPFPKQPSTTFEGCQSVETNILSSFIGVFNVLHWWLGNFKISEI
jgi:hypothetical protein